MLDWPKEIRAAIAGLDIDSAREASLVEELSQHLTDRYNELRRNGVEDAEACRLLRAELNDGKLVVELGSLLSPSPDATTPGLEQGERLFAGIGNDLRQALRLLRLNPRFAAVAILSLALGIGANTAIFELIDAVLMRTLPVPSPQQLADIQEIHGGRIGSTVARQREFSFAIWDQLRQQQKAFSAIAAWSTERFDMGQGGEARYAEGMWVSGSLFQVLQVRPVLGRLITPSDDYRGCGVRGAVISNAFWHREFGGRSNVIGSKLALDGHPFEIIGVTAPSFYGLEVGRNFDVALPLCSEPVLHGEGAWTADSTTWWLAAIGRLNAGWSFQQASAQLAGVAPGIYAATLPAEYDAAARKDYLRFSLKAEPAATGASPLRKQYADPLWVLLSISGLVLLIACANLANLMLARAGARQREMALRLALGASRLRLIRQLVAESLLLALGGAVIGMAMAQMLGGVLIAYIANGQDPVFLPLYPDLRVLAFTFGVALLTCVLFGVAPAIHASHADPGSVMKTSGRGLTAGRQRFLLRRGLIISQVALSLVLLVAALLFVRTFRNLLALDAGFQQDNVLVADFDFSALNVGGASRLEFKRELLERVKTTPGVASAAETSIVPLSGDGWNEFIDIPGTSVSRKLVYFDAASAGYFQTLQIPMLAGRDFSENDTVASPRVAVVNQQFVRTFFAGANPVGKTFGRRQSEGKPDQVFQIVGLVGNTKYRDLRENSIPIIFIAEYQIADPDTDSTCLVRSSEAPAALIPSLKDTAGKLSPAIVLNFSVLRTSVLETLTRERLMATLSGFYGTLAAVLAMVGIYGIISYMVVRRRNEIGVRIALGAGKISILGMILRETLILLGIGLVAGTGLAAVAGNAARAMLFGLEPFDPLSLALAAGGLTLIAMAASAIPAVRAADVDPVEMLREE
ncbi:MAG TPA: ABC transporter permease [Terracidiphilus sp.]|nr:ABC transporter permease [Terracidiphilus sp.]